MRDSLTGVYNRAYLEGTLARDLARAARENAPLSILMLDVDNFKKINDKYGHKMGDEVICAIGKLLKDQTREGWSG
jgi:diguanylate cyclase (GGDEF)-like protein